MIYFLPVLFNYIIVYCIYSCFPPSTVSFVFMISDGRIQYSPYNWCDDRCGVCDFSKTGVSSPVWLLCPLVAPRRHPPHHLWLPILSISVDCIDVRWLHWLSHCHIGLCEFTLFCLYSFLHGWCYANYGMKCACWM